MLLISGGVAWAVVQSLNGQSGNTQTFSNDPNVTITSVNDIHSLGWSGRLPISRGGTGNGSFTTGSILFSSAASISQDNANLFWDNTNNRLGVGTSSPAETVDINGTARATQITTNTISATGTNQSLSLNPTGTGKVLVGGESLVVARLTSEPASGSTGQIYFDTTLGKFRGYNGTDWVTFLDAATRQIRVLVVAGGGGGGYDRGGGGGGGGYIFDSAHSVTAGTYTITIGDGGTAGGVGVNGGNGGNSSFVQGTGMTTAITATGGGGGASAGNNGSNGVPVVELEIMILGVREEQVSVDRDLPEEMMELLLVLVEGVAEEVL